MFSLSWRSVLPLVSYDVTRGLLPSLTSLFNSSDLHLDEGSFAYSVQWWGIGSYTLYEKYYVELADFFRGCGRMRFVSPPCFFVELDASARPQVRTLSSISILAGECAIFETIVELSQVQWLKNFTMGKLVCFGFAGLYRWLDNDEKDAMCCVSEQFSKQNHSK